jgi:hypothetical protein
MGRNVEIPPHVRVLACHALTIRNGVHAEVKTILGFGNGAAPGISPNRFSPPDPEHFGFHVLCTYNRPA